MIEVIKVDWLVENMYAKKIIFSGLSVPAVGKWLSLICHITTVAWNLFFFLFSVFLHQCAEYQNRRGVEKEREAERRQKLLTSEPSDITPANKSQNIWSSAASVDKFENEWSMKPVQLRGIFDHKREIQVQKERNGEKGVDIITPFYTHLDANG